MRNRNLQKAQQLRATVTKLSPLAFSEAEAQLPELVMAELAGEDVDSIFADVFNAFSHYPELAEQYELLLEEMRSDLADLTPVSAHANLPEFVPSKQQSTPSIILRHLGEQMRGFLVQLMPRPLPEPIAGRLSSEALEYISEAIPDRPVAHNPKPGERPRPVELVVELQAIDASSWELVVVMIPSSSAAWQVTATLDDTELPVITQDRYETRFGPLSTVPTQPITLVCRPTTC